jgi:hypothetical protein
MFDDLNDVLVGYADCYSKSPGFESLVSHGTFQKVYTGLIRGRKWGGLLGYTEKINMLRGCFTSILRGLLKIFKKLFQSSVTTDVLTSDNI